MRSPSRLRWLMSGAALSLSLMGCQSDDASGSGGEPAGPSFLERLESEAARLHYTMASLADFAYAEEQDAAQVLEPWGFSPPVWIEDTREGGTDIRAFVSYRESRHELVISVRGTASIENWITDFDTEKAALFTAGDGYAGPTMVHGGFLRAAQAVMVKLSTALAELPAEQRSAPVHLTGHSLGGAVAQILALILEADANISVAGVHTFGAPWVGGPCWARRYQDALGDVTYHYANENDRVPGLLDQDMGFYRSGGRHFLIVEQGLQGTDAAMPACSEAMESRALRSLSAQQNNELLMRKLDAQISMQVNRSGLVGPGMLRRESARVEQPAIRERPVRPPPMKLQNPLGPATLQGAAPAVPGADQRAGLRAGRAEALQVFVGPSVELLDPSSRVVVGQSLDELTLEESQRFVAYAYAREQPGGGLASGPARYAGHSIIVYREALAIEAVDVWVRETGEGG